ncbi:helix-turn-helix domain-containing protein [Lentisphaera marina]|uniref:helix-turn-helix domain-containing protein n=1 Tax=Lentisphaera marina TaxID=1111041 RepID=UPI003B680F4D
MCQKFKVSRRSFENSFRKYFGNSPAAYFKKMKLMKIRHDILNLKDRQISSVLVKFENLHISHFGQFYKRYFGESMSQTLKSR